VGRFLSVRFGAGEPTVQAALPEAKKMVDENAQLVPLVKLGNEEFPVDIENRKSVDKNNFNRCIDMHSKQGCNKVNEMAGMEWRRFTVYPGKQDGMEV
jgi:hypothetical protein